MKRRLMLLWAYFFIGVGLATAQTQKITGVVISEEDGQPVIGASVRVEGTQLGTITDVDGTFTLTNVPSTAETVQVSFVGMQTQTVAIAPEMRIVLSTDMGLLDEVVVVGYGTGKKLGSVVGSVATVNNEKLEAKPSMNFGDALQGQVAGLQVMTSSGEPTATSSMRIRGVSTLNAGTEPLYILDGAPVSSSVFTSLNPNDIEHITVLKDAASTSIYGARAANGVIFITTKRGKGGETAEVTIRGTYGISQLPDMDKDMMNAQQFMQFQAMMNPNIVNDPAYQQQLALINKYGLSMNWQDYIMNDNAPTYTVDASISGSSEKTNYYISAGHFDQEGTSFQSYLKRHNVRMSLNTKVNDWLRVGMNAYLSYRKYSTTASSSDDQGQLYTNAPLTLARMGRPIDFAYEIIENGDGSWSRGEDQLYLASGATNPMFMYRNSRSVTEQTRGNMMAFEELTPVKGLTLRAQQAYEGYVIKLRSESDPWENNEFDGSLGERFQRGSQWTFTNTAEYKNSFNKVHNLTLLAGQESIMYGTDVFAVSGQGIKDLRLYQISNLPPSTLGASGGREEYVYNSYFARAEYNYDEKYYVEGSYRRDGSSRFSPKHRWANFYAFGLMWNLKKEAWLQDAGWMDDLRLKVTYGTTGNSELDSNYAYMGSVASSSSYNYAGQSGWIVGTVGNEDLTWETQKNLTAGFSARLFDRLDLNFDYYRKTTVDMLLNVPMSWTTGHSSVMANVGSMRNQGFEASFAVDIFNNNRIKWNIYGNVAYNKTIITKLYNGLDELTFADYGMKWQVGHDPNELFLVKWAGVDPRDGEVMYYDLNGNKTKNYSQSYMQFSGKHMISPWNGGFGTTVSWKGLTVNADFSWIGERWMTDLDRLFAENPGNISGLNQTVRMLDMWMEPGDVTNVPKASVARTYFGYTDMYNSNAAFLRLKNLTVSYDLPQHLLKKTKVVKGVRVFATGRNILTFTNYTGLDPEVDSNGTRAEYPNPRQYTIGLEVKF